MRAAALKLTRALEIFRPVQIEVARQQAITGTRFFERADGHPENLRGTPGNGAKHLRHQPARPDQIVAPVRTGAQHNVRGVEKLHGAADSFAAHPWCVGAHDHYLFVAFAEKSFKRQVKSLAQVAPALQANPPSAVQLQCRSELLRAVARRGNVQPWPATRHAGDLANWILQTGAINIRSLLRRGGSQQACLHAAPLWEIG